MLLVSLRTQPESSLKISVMNQPATRLTGTTFGHTTKWDQTERVICLNWIWLTSPSWQRAYRAVYISITAAVSEVMKINGFISSVSEEITRVAPWKPSESGHYWETCLFVSLSYFPGWKAVIAVLQFRRWILWQMQRTQRNSGWTLIKQKLTSHRWKQVGFQSVERSYRLKYYLFGKGFKQFRNRNMFFFIS